MSPGKIISGIVAFAIYLSIIFAILFFYNIHKTKAKNYVEKNADRITVTLVNSNKTVFNKSSEISNHKKVTSHITPPISKNHISKKVIPKKHTPKKVVPKKHTPKKHTPKKVVPKKHTPKKHTPKKVVPKKHTPKKHTPKKVVPKKHTPKKHTPKKVVPKKHTPKKHTPKKIIPIIEPEPISRPKIVTPKAPPKIHVPKKSANDLFSSIKTKAPTIKVPKKRPQHRVEQSHIKHNSSITDRIKATHQSGRTSNRNREQGVKNAYIAKVKQRMRDWDAVGMRGQLVVINLTIYQSGKFTFTIEQGVHGSMRNSLKQYLNRLNQMGGLGRHTKSSPYSIQVRFRVN